MRNIRALQLPSLWGTLGLGSHLVILCTIFLWRYSARYWTSQSLQFFSPPFTLKLYSSLNMPVIRNPFRRAAPSTPFNTSSESVITENLSQSTVSLADSGKPSAVEDVRPPRLASAISIPKGPDEGYKLSGGYPSCSRMCMNLCAHPNVFFFFSFPRFAS